ncbi:MAG: M48 family metallopeptidase [Dysgonamonadaceae bacterium]|nr:M48 family metallopeptidase [Dysgonamonadaceae bacterium]
MKYVGLHTQQVRNNFRSTLLLCLFPCLVIVLTFIFSVLLTYFTADYYREEVDIWGRSLLMVQHLAPFILGGVVVWFLIAYFANTSIIQAATGTRPLERKENKRVYNLVENLCMAQGMTMPKINVIEDDSLNAFASGINEKTYTVSLSRGIINKLDDEELEGVIAHELSHIRNRDVRLLIVSIVFVGIFAMLTQVAVNALRFAPLRSRNNDRNGGGAIVIILIALVVAAIGFFFATLMRFAISRNREYMADAGAAEMTRKPLALASALQKISQDPDIEAVKRDDVAQLFIEHPRSHDKAQFLSGISGLFATHPPIKKRIAVLEQF